jgi:MFS family permease
VSTTAVTHHRIHTTVILAVLAIGGLAYAMLSSAVIPALPDIRHALHTSEEGVTWLLTGYLLSASIATSILGRLGDMYGKERLLVATLVLLAVGTAVSALATSLVPMVIGRVIQGAGGGIFPLAFGIVRDEFPRDKVAGSIGILSSILGVGGGIGIVLGGLIVEHLDYHWLYWIPLIAISETTVWGWGSVKTIALLLAGLVLTGLWVLVEVRATEPLIDMAMMRIRGVWTTNLVAFLLGAGMYAAFLIFPQFAQLPTSTGFGFGASIVTAGLYLLPAALGMSLVGSFAGTVARRYGSRFAVIAGSAITALAFAWLAVLHAHPYDMLISAALMGIGIGLAFAALGNLIVQAVPPHQTGVASGMNTVMRTLGGALGGTIVATLIADNTAPSGLPTVSGFTLSFALEATFLVIAVVAALLVPAAAPQFSDTGTDAERQLSEVGEAASALVNLEVK